MNDVMQTDRQASADILPLRLLLSFSDQDYEKCFVTFYSDFYYRYAQSALAIGLLLLLGDYLIDLFVYPAVTANTYRLRLCVPFLAAGLGYSFLKQGRKSWEIFMSGLIVVLALMLFAVLLEIDKQGGQGLTTWVGILNFTILELYCFVIVAVRFKHALVAGTLIFLGFECAMYLSLDTPFRTAAYLTYHVVTVAMIAAGIGWWREFLLRKNYVARTTLEGARSAAELAVQAIADSARRREKALSLMEATLEATDNGILVVDMAGRVVSANRRFAEMWQIPEQLLARHDDQAIVEHVLDQLTDPAQFLKKVKSLYEKPNSVSRDTLLFHDGRAFARFSHPHKLNNEVVGRVWSFLDISEQYRGEQRILQLSKALNEELERSERQRGQLDSLLNAIPDLVWMKDPNGIFLSCNPAFEKLIGTTSAEIIGKSDDAFFPEAVAKAFHADDKSAIDSSVPLVREEWVTFLSDGHRSLLETVRTAVRNKDDKILGVLGVARDITKVHDLMGELERARTEALHSSEAKSIFLANMSHEIRTPLNAVLGFARIGMRENDGRKAAKTCQYIWESGSHLLDVINDIIDFSKVEAGKMTVEIQSFRLRGVVERVIDMLADRAHTKGIKLVTHFIEEDRAPSFVIGDPLRLRQVLINLVSNAIKFTEQGEVRLSISREGERTVFRVADTGSGIKPENLARLFQAFEQADNSITRKYGGSGLGLAISRSLAILMGGDISVASTVGQGSEFTLRLSLPEGMPVSEESFDRTLSVGPQLTGLRVLAAEDIYLNRLILEDLITTQGASVSFALDGQQAVDAVRNGGATAFDVVLMDIQMPVMDGYAATQGIRAIAPNLPVIGLTAHAMYEERERCLASGMVAHVAKPIQEDLLITAILQNVSRVSASRAGEPSSYQIARSEPANAFAPEATLIDWAALSLRYGNRQDFINKLLVASLDSHGDTPRKLSDAVQGRDREAVRALAHALISITGNLSATELAALARRTELSVTEASDDYMELAQRLAVQTGELMALLRARLS